MATGRTVRTLKKRDSFLEELRLRGNVFDACQVADLTRSVAYAWRQDDADFAAAWETALDEAADRMEREAHRRAVEGVDKPIYHQGVRVDVVREYSDTLLIFLLKAARPEKFRENKAITLITPDKAADMTDEELEAELKKRGIG